MAVENKVWRPFESWFEGLKAVAAVLTALAAIVVGFLSIGSGYFNVASERVRNEAALVGLRKENLEQEKKELLLAISRLQDQQASLASHNIKLKEELQGYEAEKTAIQKLYEARGIRWNFALLGDGYSEDAAPIDWDLEHKGFKYNLEANPEDGNKPKLRSKELAATDVLKDIPSLKVITISNCLLSGPSLRNFSGCQNVVSIDFRNCGIDGDMIAHLDSMPNLESLSLWANPISTLKHMKTQPRLKRLDVQNANITDDDVGEIVKLFPNVELITLDGCPLTDNAANKLVLAEKLKVLSLLKTKVGKDGLKHLMAIGREFTVLVGSEQITVEELEELRGEAPSGFKISHPSDHINTGKVMGPADPEVGHGVGT
jgi:hypothetical protein